MRTHSDFTCYSSQAIKNEAELQGMREAHLRDAVALCELLYALEKGVSVLCVRMFVRANVASLAALQR